MRTIDDDRSGGMIGAMLRSLVAAAVVAAALTLAGAASAPAATTWLCRPGKTHDPCQVGLRTTRISATGASGKVFTPPHAKRPPVDCFYVYPTVSDQQRAVATKRIDPEERSIARYQVARYASTCRIYAPMYRQVTLRSLAGTITAKQRGTGYRDVRAAWRDYLRHDNHGRGVVLVGHSQGTFVLRQLIRQEIDPSRTARRRLVAAVLLGGNVLVKRGRDAGGDFRHVRACRSVDQLGCVIAFSTYNATPPADSAFGRPSDAFGQAAAQGTQVLCTNPAALAGGTARIRSIEPTVPFAPSTTLGAIVPQVGFPATTARTPWVEADGIYRARCSKAGGASVLRISAARAGAPALRALPDATWGLHLVDANIALGDLIDVVTRQARRYVAVRG
jgi:Protein of unknown function (DUF3089)